MYIDKMITTTFAILMQYCVARGVRSVFGSQQPKVALSHESVILRKLLQCWEDKPVSLAGTGRQMADVYC